MKTLKISGTKEMVDYMWSLMLENKELFEKKCKIIFP